MDRRVEALRRQADQYERDGLHRDLEGKTETATDRNRTKAIALQVTEDFGRIQSIYNDILRTITSGKTLDQTFVSESLSGINKCAGRLKSNLALPQSKEKSKNEDTRRDKDEQLKAPLTALLNHISNFVTNPLFESTGVLDIELSTRASRDLNEIIELSNSIRKSIEKTKSH
ncbi:MAG: hypothetical protein ACREBG_16305 [Pyrinomonadaceae bacterium]